MAEKSPNQGSGFCLPWFRFYLYAFLSWQTQHYSEKWRQFGFFCTFICSGISNSREYVSQNLSALAWGWKPSLLRRRLNFVVGLLAEFVCKQQNLLPVYLQGVKTFSNLGSLTSVRQCTLYTASFHPLCNALKFRLGLVVYFYRFLAVSAFCCASRWFPNLDICQPRTLKENQKKQYFILGH